MGAFMPLLAIVAGYFLTRRLATHQSERGRVMGYALGGLGLIVLGTLEVPEVRSLQIFGLGTLLYGVWRGWKHIPTATRV